MSGQNFLVLAVRQDRQIYHKDYVQRDKGRNRQANGRQDQPSAYAIQVFVMLVGWRVRGTCYCNC
jgi:hypothetical protein